MMSTYVKNPSDSAATKCTTTDVNACSARRILADCNWENVEKYYDNAVSPYIVNKG